MDSTRGVWKISKPAVKGGEVSEQSPSLPATFAHGQEMTRKGENNTDLF